ncbi:hypothetical protein B0H10DRAFT_2320514 [Mycena sp. CBHHK59/15]|nr:hypothetical protein B0H10DRAFT_2320514 [Mycena sp. CBHHK59/15]
MCWPGLVHPGSEEIWLMGVRLPGWGVEDEERVAPTNRLARTPTRIMGTTRGTCSALESLWLKLCCILGEVGTTDGDEGWGPGNASGGGSEDKEADRGWARTPRGRYTIPGRRRQRGGGGGGAGQGPASGGEVLFSSSCTPSAASPAKCEDEGGCEDGGGRCGEAGEHDLEVCELEYVHPPKMVAPRQHRHQRLELGRGVGMHVEDEPELVGECFGGVRRVAILAVGWRVMKCERVGGTPAYRAREEELWGCARSHLRAFGDSGVLRVSGLGEESAAQRHSFSKMGKARASRAREEQRWCFIHHRPRRRRRPCHFHIFVFAFPSSSHALYFHLNFVLTLSLFPAEPPLIPTLAPPFPPRTRHAHALHARLLSWFLDAPAAPFGVHRMALAGKAAGKDVGIWFGPSAAAGALRMLVEAFPACRLAVSVATDGTLYQTEVFAASHSPAFAPSSSSAASVSSHGHSSSHGSGSKKGKESKKWGDRPVLLLLGIRLGLDGVNSIYYETIKSVGIAGGRPSSSPSSSVRRRASAFMIAAAIFVITRAPLARPTLAVPQAACARGGSTSPESGHRHGFTRGGSLSLELVGTPLRAGTPHVGSARAAYDLGLGLDGEETLLLGAGVPGAGACESHPPFHLQPQPQLAAQQAIRLREVYAQQQAMGMGVPLGMRMPMGAGGYLSVSASHSHPQPSSQFASNGTGNAIGQQQGYQLALPAAVACVRGGVVAAVAACAEAVCGARVYHCRRLLLLLTSALAVSVSLRRHLDGRERECAMDAPNNDQTL